MGLGWNCQPFSYKTMTLPPEQTYIRFMSQNKARLTKEDKIAEAGTELQAAVPMRKMILEQSFGRCVAGAFVSSSFRIRAQEAAALPPVSRSAFVSSSF